MRAQFRYEKINERERKKRANATLRSKYTKSTKNRHRYQHWSRYICVKAARVRWLLQLTMWINFTSIVPNHVFSGGRKNASNRQRRQTHTHTHKTLKNIGKWFFLAIAFLCKHRHWCVMQKKWKSKRNRREEEEKNGSFAYKWTEIRSKASSTQIKCANQPQSKMIAVFFRIMLMFLSSCFFLSLIWQQDKFFFLQQVTSLDFM